MSTNLTVHWHFLSACTTIMQLVYVGVKVTELPSTVKGKGPDSPLT